MKIFGPFKEHPYDWIGHFCLGFVVGLVRIDYSMVACATVELTQIEMGVRISWDTLCDIIADALGIGAAIMVRSWL